MGDANPGTRAPIFVPPSITAAKTEVKATKSERNLGPTELKSVPFPQKEVGNFSIFEDIDRLFMQTDIQADCEGSDCWMVELATASFPCEMTVVLDAEAR